MSPNPNQIIELLRIGAQLLAVMNQIKAQIEVHDPVLWAKIADEYNAAAKAFNGDQQ